MLIILIFRISDKQDSVGKESECAFGEALLWISQRVIDNWTETLTKYYAVLANVYHNHIIQLIKQKTEKKQIASKQLSEDEQLLQRDVDWLSQINDKLHLIERG